MNPARSVSVKTGTLVDATVIASASEADGEAGWSGHRARKAIHGYKAHVAADADTGLVERVDVTPGNVHDGRAGGAVVPGHPRPRLRRQRLPRRPFRPRPCAARGGVTRIAPPLPGPRRRRGSRGCLRRRGQGDPARSLAHREDLRNLEAQLRPSPDAMARPRQGRAAGPPDRHGLRFRRGVTLFQTA